MSAVSTPLAPRTGWFQEGAAGIVGSLAALAIVLTLGLLAFAPLRGQAAAIGIPAAFGTVIVSSIVFAWIGRGPSSAGGPSSATALIIAGLVGTLMRDPQWSADGPLGVVVLVAGASATVVLMGVWQLLLATMGLANLSKHVPQPVLAGFMNAVAVLILAAQLPLLAGLTATGHWGSDWTPAWHQIKPATVLIGLFTAALAFGLSGRSRRLPPLLIALCVGTLLHLAMTHLWPGLATGPTVGHIPNRLPAPTALWPLADHAAMQLLMRHADEIVFTSMLLAVIGTLETMLASLALDQQHNTRHDPRRVLIASGVANLVGGGFGSLPMVVTRARAQAIYASGGRSERSVVLGSVFMLLLLAFGTPVLALMPKSVLAGIMVAIAVTLLDTWTHDLLRRLGQGDRSRELLQSLAMVAAVCGTTLWQGFVAGGAVGMALAMISFMNVMQRSLLRRCYTGAVRPSRRLYGPEIETRLGTLRQRIAVFELEGPLFFASTDRLIQQALSDDLRSDVLILDFKRVSTLDESGAVALQWLSAQLRARGVAMLLAGVTLDNRLGRSLRSYGCFLQQPRSDWFGDLDQAMEAAELQLLGIGGVDFGDQQSPLEDSMLMKGLSQAERSSLLARMHQLELKSGQSLFQEGDAGDRLYVLTRGSVSVLAARRDADQPAQRLVSISPGAMLGEIALLDHAGRSATARADSDVTVWTLDRAALDDLYRDEPQLCSQLHRNIALHLADRLRAASIAWRESDA